MRQWSQHEKLSFSNRLLYCAHQNGRIDRELVWLADFCRTMYWMEAYWRHLAITTERSVGGGDMALCQIAVDTCYCSGADLRSVHLGSGRRGPCQMVLGGPWWKSIKKYPLQLPKQDFYSFKLCTLYEVHAVRLVDNNSDMPFPSQKFRSGGPHGQWPTRPSSLNTPLLLLSGVTVIGSSVVGWRQHFCRRRRSRTPMSTVVRPGPTMASVLTSMHCIYSPRKCRRRRTLRRQWSLMTVQMSEKSSRQWRTRRRTSKSWTLDPVCNKRLRCLPKIFNKRVCYFCQRLLF